jgi:hypothetical protein
VIGSALAGLSSAAPWSGDEGLPLGFDHPNLGFDVPFLPLIELDPEPSILSVGLVVVVLGALGLVASLIAPLSWLRRVLGVLVLAVAVLFIVQVVRSVLDAGEPADLLFRVGLGPYVALVGGLLMVLGRGRRRSARRSRGGTDARATPTPAPAPQTTATTQPLSATVPPPSGPIQPAPFSPTHRVPIAGLPSWTEPDLSAEVGPTLEAGLRLQVVERRAAWALVRASNGWTGWVDARKLELSPD